MGSRKNRPRFTVIRSDSGYVIVDGTNLKIEPCPPGTSKAQASELCDERNGIPKPKLPVMPSISRQFREKGVTMEEIDAHEVAADWAWQKHRRPDLIPDDLAKRQQKALDNYRNWLPPLLRMWADQIRKKRGYGTPDFIPRFDNPAVQAVHEEIWPHRRDLIQHYLAPGSADDKADAFDVSKSTYLRQIRSAHEWLALRFITGRREPIEAIEWQMATRRDERDDGFCIGMADFSWQKE